MHHPAGALTIAGATLSCDGHLRPKKDEDLISRMRSEVRRRGADTIAGLGRRFRIADRDRDQRICFDEFSTLCAELQPDLTDDDVAVLWKMFDVDGGGHINYTDVLVST